MIFNILTVVFQFHCFLVVVRASMGFKLGLGCTQAIEAGLKYEIPGTSPPEQYWIVGCVII